MSEPPELYWSPEHGLISRTHPDSLGGGRYIAAEYRSGRYLNDGLPADAVRLVAGRAAAELPVIPGGFKLQRDRVAFISYEGNWHLIGPARMLPVGHLVLVERFSEPDDQEVLVGTHVAERTVRHADGETVTYAIAEIDKGDNR
ncbi:hypothetical protein [Actinophytocola sp.]|uniref:hypothetical protein n=1 Tax=Actinophytocola sp. TaxID=1872138 RepID=UPI002D802537|nr:hypothetical protein [Actinophytocola sp.]HET9144112.1 hypothetical protein [Actinophytocola sp.]